MATLELEADFVKGLRLMFSTTRDAPDALRNMLDEAIRAKYGSSKSLGTFQPTKLKVEEEFSTSQILTERNNEDSASSKDDDDNVLDLEMMEEDLACAVCRGMNVGPRNRLVECLECHALYHQECHRPAILDQDISDPRLAWYCSTCSRNMHRPAPVEPPPPPPPTSSKQSSSKSSSSKTTFKSSGSSRDSPTNTKSSSSSSRSESSSQSLFKRAEKSSTNSSSSSSTSHKSAPSGLAALAASLQPSSKSSSSGGSSHKSSNTTSSSSKSSSSHTSSSSKNFSSSGSSSSQTNKGSPSSPTLSGLNADRRLQNMKKKAAAKIQEKRKHSK